MFTGSAAGTFLPPMVVYKSEIKYREWICGGPVNTVYDCTKNGCFNSPTFETWFFKQFVPSIVDLSGQIVLIGDNLGSHFSSRVLEYCSKNNIFYLFTTKLNTHVNHQMLQYSGLQKQNGVTYQTCGVEIPDVLITFQKLSFHHFQAS